MSESVLYTIGTALNRAHAQQMSVDLLVEGVWVSGMVAAVDGHGVVLAAEEHEHAVVRIQSVSAVRIHAPAPQRAEITGAAQPMRGPRERWE